MLLTKLKKSSSYVVNTLRSFWCEILVFLLFVLMRLPALGYDTFNTDVWKWKQRIYDFGTGVFTANFEMTIQKYHPGVTLMWIGAAAVKFFNAFYKITTGGLPADNNIGVIFELNFLQKLFIVLVLGFVVAMIFSMLKKLFGLRYAVIAVALFSLEPFYVALSREIHLEALMATFMVASFVYLFAYLKESSRRLLYISGIFAALAVLTKSSALFLLPFTGLLFLVEKRKIGLALKDYWPWLGTAILTFVLLWPAMWVAPLEALKTLGSGIFNTGIEEGHIQLYFGRLVQDPGSFFYPVVLWLKTSLYIVVGVIAFPFIKKRIGADGKKFALYLLLFASLYLIEMTIPAKKLDRYALPAIMALVLVAAFFFDYLAGKVKFGLILILLPAIATTIYLHPNYFSYYSPLSGGLEKGMFIVGPKWIFGQRELTSALSKIKQEDNLTGFEGSSLKKLYYKEELKQKLVVSFPVQYFSQLYPFVYTLDGWPTIDSLREDARQSNYFVYPVWDQESDAFTNYNLVYRATVYMRGVPIYNIYDRVDK